MHWLPSLLLLLVGVVLLAGLVFGVVEHLRRTKAAARTMAVAVTGRRMRVRAGVAELTAWRAARRSGERADPGA